MERPANSSLHEQLFSRGSATPPLPSQSQLFAMNQPQPTSSSPPSYIDSLFQSITSQQQAALNPKGNNSAPATPSMTANEEGSASAGSSATSAADRQSALLSLLAATSVAASTHLPPLTGPPASQQIPTPPASSSQRSGQSPSNNSETQGKILLEQLMAG
ncbi:hypothetical protein BS17DRAFT_812632 [Gyrodon lividus]|nr:hypothetical protein BS17DRAFT_812632 [Gyrodon lividus]